MHHRTWGHAAQQGFWCSHKLLLLLPQRATCENGGKPCGTQGIADSRYRWLCGWPEYEPQMPHAHVIMNSSRTLVAADTSEDAASYFFLIRELCLLLQLLRQQGRRGSCFDCIILIAFRNSLYALQDQSPCSFIDLSSLQIFMRISWTAGKLKTGGGEECGGEGGGGGAQGARLTSVWPSHSLVAAPASWCKIFGQNQPEFKA